MNSKEEPTPVQALAQSYNNKYASKELKSLMSDIESMNTRLSTANKRIQSDDMSSDPIPSMSKMEDDAGADALKWKQSMNKATKKKTKKTKKHLKAAPVVQPVVQQPVMEQAAQPVVQEQIPEQQPAVIQ